MSLKLLSVYEKHTLSSGCIPKICGLVGTILHTTLLDVATRRNICMFEAVLERRYATGLVH